MKRSRAYKLVWGVPLIITLFALPHFLPEAKVYLATEALIYALFAVGFNLLFGYVGQLPFGFAALFGVGAYVTALIINHYPAVNLLWVLLFAALSAFIVAAVIGFFCVRLSGAYFALTTLAFQMFLFAIALKWRSVTNGDDGMGVVRPELYLPAWGSISLRSTASMYFFTLVMVATAIFGCYLLLKTPLGNSFVCVREKEERASFLGYNVFLIKLTAFSAAGFLAGLGGGLFVLFQEFVATTCMDMNMGLTPVLMTIIGGPNHFLGPVLGAAFYVVFQDWISSLTRYWMFLMGGIFIVTVLYLKGGLIGLLKLKGSRGPAVTGDKNGSDITIRQLG
jgi:branched-chain amino acid transport system permease protein